MDFFLLPNLTFYPGIRRWSVNQMLMSPDLAYLLKVNHGQVIATLFTEREKERTEGKHFRIMFISKEDF